MHDIGPWPQFSLPTDLAHLALGIVQLLLRGLAPFPEHLPCGKHVQVIQAQCLSEFLLSLAVGMGQFSHFLDKTL